MIIAVTTNIHTSVLINSGGNELTKSQGKTAIPLYKGEVIFLPKPPHLSQIE